MKDGQEGFLLVVAFLHFDHAIHDSRQLVRCCRDAFGFALQLGRANDYAFTLSHLRQLEAQQRVQVKGKTEIDGSVIIRYGVQIEFKKDVDLCRPKDSVGSTGGGAMS